METIYVGLLGCLAVVVIGLLLSQAKDGDSVAGSGSHAFYALRNNYVFVYALMMAGDWLQGPYVYALYQHYGYDVKDIGRLFIAGFGSSMVFGTVVGSLADKHGRKKAALLYVLTYAASCATKHSPQYGILMLGRLLGGVATSLLFSAFESWLVAEHAARGLEPKWIGSTFSWAVFVGNGLMAILSGLIASFLVDKLGLGPVAPFDAAALVLLVGGAVVARSWPENYGAGAAGGAAGGGGGGEGLVGTLRRQFAVAAGAILGDQRIALLGAIQSLFEAAMYSFVFLWTPALAPGGEAIPHGMIFACFMTASMAGSSASGMLMKRVKVETYMKYVFSLAAMALAVPFLCNVDLGPGLLARSSRRLLQAAQEQQHQGDAAAAGLFDSSLLTAEESGGVGRSLAGAAAAAAGAAVRGISLQGKIQLVAFCVFEVLVGAFWPSMMTLRARFIPEETRSTIINIFRIPLNLFVCVILYNVHLFPISSMFALCATFLAVAALLQVRLEKLIQQSAPPAFSYSAKGAAAAGAVGLRDLRGSREGDTEEPRSER
ncbi:hypothetical protein Agub_g7865 [Astrephomene gubernaculifera]|uniref:Molybdate-anion transporter n=1 Tax=Astrephomene gubernaculifera TaxID=47775 RepID=A0AAD3HMN2_9CHLO|nr:hypothetical protein Agub_g7865 [Astrephomene gubernaculifera]